LKMHPNAERIQTELKALGAGGTVVELAASTRTSQEARKAEPILILRAHGSQRSLRKG